MRIVAAAVLVLALVTGCSSSDFTSPLQYQLPEEGATLSAPTLLSVAGEDITSATFLVDDAVVDLVESAPFESTLDPSVLTEGSHDVTVRVQRSGGEESVSVTIMIPPPNPEPPPPPPPPPQNQVAQWKRYEVALPNATWSGNPFDLEVTGAFTHTGSGRTVRHLGFYAGNDVWKIFFMPDETGTWTFATTSADADMNNKTGSLECIASTLPGRLMPAGNRWKLDGAGKHDAPIIIPISSWFKSTDTANGVDRFIDWAKDTAGARLIGITFVFFRRGQEEEPFLEGTGNEEFYIPFWDRLNSHFDAIRDAGMGHYIMIYTDSDDSPARNNMEPKSANEIRLFRYLVARFAAYPIVMWDTGIDIREYRANDWITWYAEWFTQNDPWGHPVGSRSGGGSGGIHPSAATYWSDGTKLLPDRSTAISNWTNRSVPTAYTDRWRENFGRGGFTPDVIRQAVWEIGLVGGGALIVSGSHNEEGLGSDYASDFEAAPTCGYAAEFFREEIVDLGKLSPHDELVLSGTAVLSADPGNEYVAHLRGGGSVSIDLTNASGTFVAQFYNPRDGTFENPNEVTGGSTQVFSAPDSKDWVLHLTKK